jgi:ABC-type nitrate/sulfonate/bicarbonate transport system substrate-binding protein
MVKQVRWTRRQFLRASVTLTAGYAAWPLARALGGPRMFNLGTVAITWYPIFLYHLPTTVAVEKGYLRSEGIEIREIVGRAAAGRRFVCSRRGTCSSEKQQRPHRSWRSFGLASP